MQDSSSLWIALGLIGASALLIIGFTTLRDRPVAPVDVPPIAADDHARGATSSPLVVITEYYDFECPACASYAPIMKQLEAEFGDRVAFVGRYFPLPQHLAGIPAAIAAEAAGRQGKYWEMHDVLFATQDQWARRGVPAPEVFEAYATQLGLDIAQFRMDVADPAARERVERDRTQGQAIGVDSTPTFFLDGVKLNNPRSIEAFRALIQEALAARGVPQVMQQIPSGEPMMSE